MTRAPFGQDLFDEKSQQCQTNQLRNVKKAPRAEVSAKLFCQGTISSSKFFFGSDRDVKREAGKVLDPCF